MPNFFLKKEKDFERVARFGRSQKQGFLVLKFIKNGENMTRFGISVSKKVSKKAVVRNKIKRRISALARRKIGGILEGLDIFFLVLPGFEKLNFAEIDEIINELLKKAKILK